MGRRSTGHFAERLRGLLEALALDVTYHRAAGAYLYYRDPAGRAVEVLDAVGGYGTALFGHNHPALVAEAQRLLAAGVPHNAQGSIRAPAERLAAELSRRAGGDYRVVFGSTGAEVVEAALKHAMIETGSRTFIAVEGAFHGKTLAAGALTDRGDDHREALPGLDVRRVRRNDIDHLQSTFAAAGRIAGFVVEPIQGEGGVRPLDPAFLQRAALLCAQHDAPLIADECQSGAGRTGRFLACEHAGIRPDYVTLAKALGGGLAKVAALLVRRERYAGDFDLTHTSTFAGDDFGCALALRTLELLDEPMLAHIRGLGDELLRDLHALRERYPQVIADVRGRGVMLAVELRRLDRSPSYILRALSAQEDLLLVLAGYLLRVHRVRMAPSLGSRFTLRVQPSALIDEAGRRRLIGALEEACDRLARGDAEGLTAFLAGDEDAAAAGHVHLRSSWKPCTYHAAPAPLPHPAPPRVAWLCHLIDADDLVSLDRSFEPWPTAARHRWLDRLAPLAGPVLMSEVDVRSASGARVRLCPIMLPVTSAWMKRWIARRRFRELTGLVETAAAMARSLGCELLCLGQYTSIATLNGTMLHDAGIALTTGNGYAVSLAIEAIDRAERERGVDPARSTLAVIGAAGNIGSICARLLAPRYRGVSLGGSGGAASRERLQRVAAQIDGADVRPAQPTSIADDAAAIVTADVVVAATNAVDAPLQSRHLAHGAIVCDISVPATIARHVPARRADLLIIRGGIARLPGGEDLGIVGFPLEAGLTYGCMAEALLLGFERRFDSSMTGVLEPAQVTAMSALAARHGFELADYKTACVLGSERQEPVHAHA